MRILPFHQKTEWNGKKANNLINIQILPESEIVAPEGDGDIIYCWCPWISSQETGEMEKSKSKNQDHPKYSTTKINSET